MSWIINILVYLWDLFKLWIHTLFVTPVQNTTMLWILVPVWLGWFLAEFFQEKTGTSMGNAISNSVIVFWGSIDWFRQTVALISERVVTGLWNIIARYALAGIVFIYGALIIFLGIKGKKVIQRTGRIREVTYVFAMFTPIFYNVIPFSINHVIATLLFFPLFYFTIELIDKYTPNPRAIIEDNAAIAGQSSNELNKIPTLGSPLSPQRAGSYNQSFASAGMNKSYSSPLSRAPSYPGYGSSNRVNSPSGSTPQRPMPQRPGGVQQRSQSYNPFSPKI